MLPCGARVEHEVQDHADDGKKEDDQDPDKFVNRGHRRLKHRDDSDDVEDEDDEAEETAEGVHGFPFRKCVRPGNQWGAGGLSVPMMSLMDLLPVRARYALRPSMICTGMLGSRNSAVPTASPVAPARRN